MCGIVGYWPTTGVTNALGVTRQMIETLRHRGPDGDGLWQDGVEGPVLAHARLAIVDLSPAGAQPMHSATGRFCISFNGEIYNHAEIRSRLERENLVVAQWRGHSDTETLLAAIEAWGLEGALDAATGMFAVALWDGLQRRLTLVRDRFGEKPLYYAMTRSGLVFASELKALMQSGLIERRLSRDAAAAMLRFNNIPAPQTVFEDVFKLSPGHLIDFGAPTRPNAPRAYWQAITAWQRGQTFSGSDPEAVHELERRLSSAIGDQMVADVPLGAFLSGGIDSSTVVALMQAQSARPVKTFSIGFDDPAYNEADAAKAVAAHLGTEHTELYVTPQDALGVIPHLATMYCEPFADSSQIPTHLVARMARKHVTVALSGDGGDEVFGGYNRYLFGPGLQRRIASIPRPLRRALARLIDALPPQRWDTVVGVIEKLLPSTWRFKDAGDKLAKLARALPARNAAELYESFISQWPTPTSAVPGSVDRRASPEWHALGLQGLSFAEQMMIQDVLGYLPGDILTKVDRAAMSVSLEGRIPFLDHHLYEFAATLPMRFKVRDGVTKWLLRQVLYRHVPQGLIDRPKVGFGIPLDRWLRGDLRDWAESLLSRQSLAAVGMFDATVVRDAWQQHLSGRRNLQHPLWCVLMYQAWHQEFMAP